MHYDDNFRIVRPIPPKGPDYRGFKIEKGLHYDEREDVHFQVRSVIDGLFVIVQEVFWSVEANEFLENGSEFRVEWVEFCRNLALGNWVPVQES